MEVEVETENKLLETVRTLMVDTLEKSRKATQDYVDLLEKTMRSLPKANGIQVDVFKAYIERQVAANHAFVDKLLHAKDFQEALRIQAEHFQSQLKAAADDAAQRGTRLAGTFRQYGRLKRPGRRDLPDRELCSRVPANADIDIRLGEAAVGFLAPPQPFHDRYGYGPGYTQLRQVWW